MTGATQLEPSPLRVAIFDDVVAARGEVFHIPGLAVDVHPHADDALATKAHLRSYLVHVGSQHRRGR